MAEMSPMNRHAEFFPSHLGASLERHSASLARLSPASTSVNRPQCFRVVQFQGCFRDRCATLTTHLNLIFAAPLEAPAIRIDRKLNSTDVIDVLSDLFILRGVPEHVRSDNGPEFIAKAVQDWIAAVGGQDRLHRAGQSMGERLHRELQCSPARRASRRRDLLHAQGGQDYRGRRTSVRTSAPL